jgi:hypothetical protein
MRTILAIFVGLALGGGIYAPSAHAQGVPQGSFLRTCTDVGMRGDTLFARCRRADGREQQASLAGVNRCVGDISNVNGALTCNFGAGGPRAERRDGRGPEYQEGYGSGFRDRCEGLRREARELRERLDREWNPMDRSRTEGRLREVRDQEERCRY